MNDNKEKFREVVSYYKLPSFKELILTLYKSIIFFGISLLMLMGVNKLFLLTIDLFLKLNGIK